MFSDVDRRDYFNHEVDDVLPVVGSSRGIGIPYAAGVVDYEWYVHKTLCILCNMRYENENVEKSRSDG